MKTYFPKHGEVDGNSEVDQRREADGLSSGGVSIQREKEWVYGF